jgi:GNAT superfamily N-acetyltransferase
MRQRGAIHVEQGQVRSAVVRLVADLDSVNRWRPEPSEPAGRDWLVRPSRPDDVSVWLEIQNEVLSERGAPRGWDRAAWGRELSSQPWWRPERLLLAQAAEDATPVGCVAVEIDPPARWAQIHWLAVRPAARRQAVATRLLLEIERLARSAGCRHLRAETLRAWPAAMGFYTAHGFQEVSEWEGAEA